MKQLIIMLLFIISDLQNNILLVKLCICNIHKIIIKSLKHILFVSWGKDSHGLYQKRKATALPQFRSAVAYLSDIASALSA